MYSDSHFFGDIPYVCLTVTEREMEKENLHHDIAELSGGPLDGKVFQETAQKFLHNPHETYLIGGNVYRPFKVVKRENGLLCLVLVYERRTYKKKG